MQKVIVFGVSITALVVIFLLWLKGGHDSANLSSENRQETAQNSTQVIDAPPIQAPTPVSSQPLLHNQRAEIVWKNQNMMSSMYDSKLPDPLVTQIKTQLYNLKTYGNLDNDLQKILAKWDKKHFDELKNMAIPMDQAIKKMSSPPTASKFLDQYQVDENVVIGLETATPYIATQLSQGDQRIFLMQRTMHPKDTQTVIQEYVNYPMGKNQDIGAVYQTYENGQYKILKVLTEKYDHTLYTININDQEFERLAGLLIENP